jgi:hypothetical protein
MGRQTAKIVQLGEEEPTLRGYVGTVNTARAYYTFYVDPDAQEPVHIYKNVMEEMPHADPEYQRLAPLFEKLVMEVHQMPEGRRSGDYPVELPEEM